MCIFKERIVSYTAAIDNTRLHQAFYRTIEFQFDYDVNESDIEAHLC